MILNQLVELLPLGVVELKGKRKQNMVDYYIKKTEKGKRNRKV